MRLYAMFAVLMLGACTTDGDVQRNTALTADTHGVNFNIADGGSHNMDCAFCHGTTDSFKDFSCTGCHNHDQATMNAAHAGLTPTFSWTPTSCYQCHAPGMENNLFNHTSFFPIRKGSRHVFECVSCHIDNADRTKLDCLTCHPQAVIQGASGHQTPTFKYESATCILSGCHGTGTNIPPAF